MCAAVAVAAFFTAGCSDDSSASCAGSCVDSGDTIDIPIPGGDTEGGTGDGSESAEAKSSSSVKTPAASSTADPVSSAAEPASSDSKPASSETASEDWRDYCLEVVNAKRATEDLPPLVRATAEREKCVVTQAADDMAANKGHANFGDCGEFAQNSGPNVQTQYYSTEKKIVDTYVNMMWDDEKKLVTSGERDPDSKDDYPYIGHYLNMKNTSYKSLACGIAYSADG
ncbi:MAG: hypothetical protein IJ734_03660, partial [Fibrobacter sp.]|nr:hypothetical protein [Fibrobacter sp.]